MIGDGGLTRYTDIYRNVQNALDCGNKAVVVTRLSDQPDSSIRSEKSVYSEDALKNADHNSGPPLARAAMENVRLQCVTERDDTLIAEPFFPESRLIILGGGHIALPLCEFASRCGFAVTVVDDRPSFANKGRFPAAREVICDSFERCFSRIAINRFTFVVIITRGHRHDLLCLRQVLKLDTAYTGMIGSRRRVKGARQQLLDEGYAADKLALVRAPIGMDIGAVTPEEIAVSILSELIQYKRRLVELIWPELDIAVLSDLCGEEEVPRALVTVIETKGSTPREAGAKMIVYPDGRLVGSIGGGCSESGVISEAYDVIREGGFKLVDIDMTGDVAEDEGMVCGGTMKVVIESISGIDCPTE